MAKKELTKTTPHYKAVEKRIDELAEAIYKYTPCIRQDEARKLIKEFATEIILQCRLVDAMYEVKEAAQNGGN